MSLEVSCNVDNCTHYQEMKCSAGSIKVNMQANMKEACSPDVTYCGTFETREC